MLSCVRIIAIISVWGITSAFVVPSLPSTSFLAKQEYPLVTNGKYASRHAPLHSLSEKELTESSRALSNADPVGAGSIAIQSEDKAVGTAIRRTLACVAAAVCFGGGLGYFFGPTTSEEFFAGYLLELSLSVDNLLVFLLLFEYFQIPSNYQNRVLNYGIIGAVLMRAIMIGAGAVAIQQFHAVLLVFAGILLYSSGSVLLGGESEEEEDLSDNAIIKLANNFIKSTTEFDGNNFFTVQNGIKLATPMFLCTVAVELSDVVFAVDSIPAVFGVTENPLVVFSSNMFAILGLRSLYTILSKAAEELEYLETSVAIILGFIGSKMIGEYFGFNVPTEVSLGVVLSLLSGGIGLSLWENSKDEEEN